MKNERKYLVLLEVIVCVLEEQYFVIDFFLISFFWFKSKIDRKIYNNNSMKWRQSEKYSSNTK